MDFFDDLPPEASGAGECNEYNKGSGWAQLKKDNTIVVNNDTKTNAIASVITTSTTSTAASSTIASSTTTSILPITLKKQEKQILTPFAFKPRQTKAIINNNNDNNKPTNATTISIAAVTTTTTTKASKFSSLVPAENTSNDIKFIHNNNDNSKSYVNKIMDHISSFDVIDAYDPIRPNDYLKLCEERVARQRAILMEEEYQQQLIEVQKAREAKEKERADAVEQGDMQKLQELSSVGRGRGGRGRGISNLPAWMTERKDVDFDKNNESADFDKNKILANEGQFDDIDVGRKRKMNTTPTNILLLKNLVSIDDVDDSLEDEIKNECSKYGKIHQVVIYQVKIRNFPDQERVRIFVEFENQSSSVLAYKEMNGRFFAGRSIDASFYDEIKFRNNDLAP